MRSLLGRLLAIAGTLAALAGCGAAPNDEASDDAPAAPLDGELGTLELALDADCGESGPVQRVFDARATALTASPTLQAQGCQGDSYMFRIESYNQGLNPLRNPSIRPAGMPTREDDCEATSLRFYVWADAVLQGSLTKHGIWKGRSLGCDLVLSAPANLVPGATYDFAISARRPADVPIPVRLEHGYR